MDMPTVGLLRLAYNELSREINRAVTRVSPETRPSHGNVMEQLQIRDGQRLTDLAEGAGMAPQSIGELVDQLEELCLVERRPDPDDRRAKRVYMTAKAEKAAAAAFEELMEIEDRLRSLLGADRLASLKSDLAKVIAASGGTIPEVSSGEE